MLTVAFSSKKVLAVDLLNPSPAAEARKHKLKVCNNFSTDAGFRVHFSVETKLTCTAGSCARSPVLLHGCQVPRLLHHYHRLLARPDRRHLPRLHHRPLPAHRWQGQTHRGLLVPEEVDGYLATFFSSASRAGNGEHLGSAGLLRVGRIEEFSINIIAGRRWIHQNHLKNGRLGSGYLASSTFPSS